MNKTIQVALVEDDAGVRANLAAMLNASPGFHCQAAYADGAAALHGIAASHPDVILMDINLPGMLGPECVRQLQNVAPGLPVLMLTVYDDSEQIFNSLMAGATGYLLKRTSKDKLPRGHPRGQQRGRPDVTPDCPPGLQFFREIERMPVPAPRVPELRTLTEKEERVLAGLAKGLAYKEIADVLNIGFETVRTHVRSIYEKLHVHSRTEAVLKYLGK